MWILISLYLPPQFIVSTTLNAKWNNLASDTKMEVYLSAGSVSGSRPLLRVPKVRGSKKDLIRFNVVD